MILRPEGGPRNHWISFALQGTKSNRLALNARVRVTAGELVERTKCAVAGAYLSQNDLRLHFGLGKHERVDKVEILWPSGTKEVLSQVSSDRFYTLQKEGVLLAPSLPVPVQCLIVDDRRNLREHGRVQRGLSLRRPVSSGFRRNGTATE